MNLPRISFLYAAYKKGKEEKATVLVLSVCVRAQDGHIMMGKGLFYTGEIRK